MGQLFRRVKRTLRRSTFSWVIILAGMSGILATLLVSRLDHRTLVGIGVSFFVAVDLGGPELMRRLTGQNSFTNESILKQLGRVLYHVRPIWDIRGSVAKMREDSPVRPVTFTHPSSLGEQKGASAEKLSLFTPGSIPSIAIESRPDAHTPGRLAATQMPSGAEGANVSKQLLSSLLNAPETARIRRVAVIGGTSTPKLVSEGFEVESLHPNQLPNACDSPFYCVVLDAAGLETGPWRGLLSASHTSLFQEAFTFLSDAKKAGSLVILVDEGIPDHFTSELEGIANIRVRGTEAGEPEVSIVGGSASAQAAIQSDLSLPIIDAIWEARKEALQ